MPTPSTPLTFDRDGTSQAGRRLASLSPGSVGIDERGLQDLLAFTDAFARELMYFDTSGLPAGDWRGFLNPGGEGAPASLTEIASFVTSPSGFGDDSVHRRPHFVLFLVFLHLLGLSRERLNRLTGEHLDFYYRRFLSMHKKTANPDSLNVIAKLGGGADQTLLPKGTLLDAGKDSQGGALLYRTDDDLIVNSAQVKDLYTVFVDKRVTGIREAREACAESGDDPRLAMIKLVYGDPKNGDQLPAYAPTGKSPDLALIEQLGTMVDYVGNGLHLEQLEFGQLMLRKGIRQRNAPTDWPLINGILEKIGRAELNAPAFSVTPADSPAFWDNFSKAFNGKLPNFLSLPGNVTGLEDLYGSYLMNSSQPDILAFIKTKLHLQPDEFQSLMAKKQAVDSDWRIVNGLLEVAGQRKRKDVDYRLLQDDPADDPYKRASTEFDKNLGAALDKPDFSAFANLLDGTGTDLDRFAVGLGRVSSYFFCSLDDFAKLVHTVPGNNPSAGEWERCYAILAGAYGRKVYDDRQRMLMDCHKGVSDKAALEAMLWLASGQRTLPVSDLLNQLAGWWPTVDGGMAVYEKIRGALTQPSPPPFTDWQNAAINLNLAWRNREGRAPVAQREEWLTLRATPDAVSVKSSRPGNTPRWRTFGQRRELASREQPPDAQIGWSIASPALCLSQGERTVTLTLVFPPEDFASQIAALFPKPKDDVPVPPAEWPFQVEVSSGKGWISPDGLTATATEFKLPSGKGYKALVFDLDFAVSAPALTALPGGASRWPMLRLLLRPLWQASADRFSTPYPLFRPLALDRVLISTTVTGLADLALANDDGPFPAGKPFEPFGSSPATGSAFRFTHPELVVKRINGMMLNLQWMKVPAANLASHYTNYSSPAIAANTDFTARFSLLDHGADIQLVDKAQLFDGSDAGKRQQLKLKNLSLTIQTSRPGYSYVPEHALIDAAAPNMWPRSWCLELNSPDFQHGNYARVVAAKSIELASGITQYIRTGTTTTGGTTTSNPPNADAYKVSPPYTPKLKSFSVDYDCVVTVIMDPADPLGYGTGDERIFHHYVFGVAEIQPDETTGMYRFLPAYDNEGELYLGLENAVSPGEVAILFQMAEGSANPDLPVQQVAWSYLSGNQWCGLPDGGILADSTRGLAQSGIVRFRLAESLPSTLLPGDRYWLRAAVTRDCDSICDCIDIKAQAVSATWLARENTAGHLDGPLAAGTIAKTAVPMAGIASVSQPYTSSGGRPAEQEDVFHRRVSERLRHKQRALTSWDYERLILERFPGICKAKCIAAVSADPADLGKVEVIVIPDIRGRLPFNPFEPKATSGQIAEIGDFIAEHVSPLASVTVKNAHYVPVRVRFAVSFLPGCDPGFYKQRLNEALNRFLAPWAYDVTSEVVIGGTIYANAILDFLERQAGVDYVAELKLFKNEDGLAFKLVQDVGDGTGYRVRADRPDGVLVADLQHDIDLIGDDRFEDAKFSGIGYMKIELDFVVG